LHETFKCGGLKNHVLASSVENGGNPQKEDADGTQKKCRQDADKMQESEN
jgi:hypothetical protein